MKGAITIALAHSANAAGKTHDLVDHLQAVADLAAQFGTNFGAGEIARWCGLWHDIGKFDPEVQRYLANPDSKRGPGHSTAGAFLAIRHLDPLAFVIAGHHSGLPDRPGLKARLADSREATRAGLAFERATATLNPLGPAASLTKQLPSFLTADCKELVLNQELFLRFIFSVLVDADFLDTENHFLPDQAAGRGSYPSLQELYWRFQADQERFSGHQKDKLNQARHEIYLHCLAATELEPGIFSLTVPTGGGKTRSSLAFALKHALLHGLERIIVAIPYTSIIEQTALVYREIFGPEAVLEHHSAAYYPEEDREEDRNLLETRARLAAEN